MNLPSEMFFCVVDWGRHGAGSNDFTTNPTAAADQAAEAFDSGCAYRVLRVQPATGDVIEVTDEIDEIIATRFKARMWEAAE